jgi:TP901 family phage tail tape measure protein
MAATNMEVSVLVSLQDKLTRPLKAMGDGFKKMGAVLKSSEKDFAALNKKMETAGATAMKTGKTLSTRVSLPILGLGIAAVKMGVDFNKGMANVSTLIDGNIPRTKALGDAMLKMSMETGVATKDLTDGLYQTVSAFGDSADTVGRMNAVAKASVAGLSTTTEALNLLSAVTKGYGDTTSAAVSKASDLAFITVKLGQTTFPELASSMGRVIPLASAMKVSQEELFAAFASLTGVTGNAAEVSTQMRGAIQSLMAPTGDMKKVLQGMGYASGQAAVQSLGLVGTLQKMVASTGGNTEKMKQLFPQIESMAAILQLSGKGAEKFKTDLLAMKGAVGATDQAFKAQTQGVNKAGFSWKKMVATMKVMAINIGQLLMPVLEGLANVFGAIFSVVNSLPGPVKAVIIAIAGILAAIGPIMMMVGAFQKWKVLIDMVKESWKTMNKLMATNPMMLKLMAIGVVIGGIIALFRKSTIKVQSNVEASKSLSAEVDDLSKSYGAAARAAGKLTLEQEAQMKLRAIDASAKALKQMEDAQGKLQDLTMKVMSTDAGSQEHEEAKLKLQVLQFATQRDMASFKTSQKLLGRSDADTTAAIQGLGTGMSRAVLGSQEGKATAAYAASGQSMQAFTMGLLKQAMVPKELAGKIFINVNSEGKATATSSWPGSMITGVISAQSPFNGGTR